MSHLDYVRTLVEGMGDREFTTQEIADLMADYWEKNRVHGDRTMRVTKAYGYLKVLAEYGMVIKTRLDYSPDSKMKVAYWRRAE